MKDHVSVEDICKSYAKDGVKALDHISFSVARGELFGLIGPDGAGKTSLFRILTTLILPDGGKAMVDGYDIIKDYKSIRRHIGYMPGKFSLYQDLTIEENLHFFATLFGTTVAANYDLIKDIYIQIEPFRKRRAGQLSGGMKQKLALCCALIHRPTVLFLDEPTTGVDAVSRKEFWAMLKRLNQEGITILVSTPYMDEASLCERIALMQGGKIMSVDTPRKIIDQYPKKLFAVRAQSMHALLDDVRSHDLVESCFAFGSHHHLTFVSKDLSNEGNLLEYLDKLEHRDVDFHEVSPSIEDCFIHLMNQDDN